MFSNGSARTAACQCTGAHYTVEEVSTVAVWSVIVNDTTDRPKFMVPKPRKIILHSNIDVNL